MAERLWCSLVSTSLLAIATAACGSDPSVDVIPSVEVVERRDAPAAGTISAMSSLQAAEAIEAIGVDDGGRVLAVAGAFTYEVAGTALEPRALYAGPGEPTSTGRVFAVVPKMEGGAWLAAETGLFILDSLYVVKSPLNVGAGALRGASHVASGPLAGLWLAGDAGLFRHRDVMLEKLPVAVLGHEAIDAIAVQGDGNAALVMAGGELATLEVEEGKILSDTPPLDSGKVHAIAAGENKAYAAAEHGLYRFDRAATPKWTRFTFSDAGQGEEVLALAVDAETGKVFARTASSIVELDGEKLARFSAFTLSGSAPALLAAAGDRDIWMAESSTLHRVTLGTVAAQTTFTADVLPWISMNCSKCHKNQTQNFEDFAVFSERAEAALTRVVSGDMPRCDGGIPCSEARLNSSEYSVLEAWIRDGKLQ